MLGLGSYQTAWLWLQKLRGAMVRPGRDRLAGWVEVDETYFGGLEEGKQGRGGLNKALIIIAAQADGKAIGRVRMRVIEDASAECLHASMDIAPATLSQAVLADFIGDSHFARHIRKMRLLYRERRDILVTNIQKELPFAGLLPMGHNP